MWAPRAKGGGDSRKKGTGRRGRAEERETVGRVIENGEVRNRLKKNEGDKGTLGKMKEGFGTKGNEGKGKSKRMKGKWEARNRLKKNEIRKNLVKMIEGLGSKGNEVEGESKRMRGKWK